MSHHWFIADLIKKNTSGKVLGLDIGSGYDNWKDFKKCKFVNIDKHPPGQVVDIESENLPFANSSFDVIISINVLNYLINFRIIKEIHRVLERGGVFVCVVNNENAHQLETMSKTKLYSLFPNDKFKRKMSPEERLCAWHYNKTSVYAFIVLEKI